MAKQAKVIKDFSGGLANGIDETNLKDNQLVRAVGIASSGSGKIGLLPDEITLSTSSVNTDMPDGAGKNIHAWSSDMNLAVSGQPSNISNSTPVATEMRKPMTARMRLYLSKINNGDKASNYFLYASVGEQALLFFSFKPNTTEEWTGETGNNKVRTHPSSSSDSTYTATDEEYRAIGLLDDFVNSVLNSQSSYDFAYETKFLTTTTYSGSSYAVASEWYYQQNSNFYITKHTTLSGAWGDDPVYSIDMYWETKEEINFTLQGSMVGSKLACMADSITHRLINSVGDNVDLTSAQVMKYHSFSNGEKTGDFSAGNNCMYVSPSINITGAYGSASMWKYELFNFNSTNQTHTFNAVIRVYTNYAQSSHTEKTLSYTSSLGDTPEQVLNGIFGQLESEIPENHMVYVESGGFGRKYLLQDHRTPYPYGFTVTASKSNTVVHNTIGAGNRSQHLVAIGSQHSQAFIYSMESDNFLDYPVDLRQTAGSTSDNTIKLSFMDAEGYLRVSDSTFLLDNKPQWFGYWTANKTYENTSLSTNAGFYYADMAPTPYGYDADNNIVGSGAINGQATHIADISHSMMKYTDGEQTINLSIPKYSNTSRGYMPHPQGIKLWYCFIDGTTSSQSATDKLEGSWNKIETLELYWTYVYEGGYVSQPTRFRQYHTDSGQQNKFQSRQPAVDGCSLGIGLSLGKQLLDGNGTTQINSRLNGIEIWARVKNSNPNDLYLMMEVDLNKGWRSPVTGEWEPLATITDASSNIQQYITQVNNTAQPISTLPIFTSPPAGITHTFYSKYGLSWDKPIGFESGGTGFKTGCVFERRAYYGNVSIKGGDGLIHKFPDGIIKSLAGTYDTFSIDNLIEATVNDGDEITCLKVVGNKLCQFKKNSLTIMGIKILENGQTRENIEKIIHHVGIQNDNQVCETPYGLFWVSRSGLFLYNGDSIKNLTSNENGSIIDKSYWESFYGLKTHCGYDAYWNQAHICKEQKNNDLTIIYDFNTASFSTAQDMYTNSQKSGFVNDAYGHILWSEVETATSNISGNASNSPMATNKSSTTQTPPPASSE